MPFPWLDSKHPPAFRASLATRRDEALRQEVRDRAGMLLRLGRTETMAAARIRANLAWELDLGAASPVRGEVDGLVREVYARR